MNWLIDRKINYEKFDPDTLQAVIMILGADLVERKQHLFEIQGIRQHGRSQTQMASGVASDKIHDEAIGRCAGLDEALMLIDETRRLAIGARSGTEKADA